MTILWADSEKLCAQVLLLFAAMNTNDPGNIRDVIAELAKANVHVSIVGLTAELYICREITRVRFFN